MKSIFTILLFLFGIQFSFTQDQPDGPYKDFYDSGELKVEGQYKNKKRIGEWKDYYKNGQVSNLYSFKEGKRNREKTAYYKTGVVSHKTEKTGDDFVNFGYYESGKLKYERQEKTGYYKSFYESGVVDIEAKYIDYDLVGIWKKYYENEQVEWIVTYKDGYRDGLYQHFYDNGDLKLEGNNSRDKVDGEEKRYLLGNILEWKGSYAEGILNKTWSRFNAEGKKIKKIKFKNGTASDVDFVDVLVPTEVAIGVFERVAIHPGCEDLLTNRTRKKCMNQNVARFIVNNFDKKMIANLGLSPGRKRIFVMFKIDKTGHVKEVKARGPHPKLETEAKRIINMLPVFKPGEQRGKSVIMPFSIPIVFQVQ